MDFTARRSLANVLPATRTLPQTPDRYYDLQDLVARFRGIKSGYKRAEAFILQIGSPFEGLPAEKSKQ